MKAVMLLLFWGVVPGTGFMGNWSCPPSLLIMHAFSYWPREERVREENHPGPPTKAGFHLSSASQEVLR